LYYLGTTEYASQEVPIIPKHRKAPFSNKRPPGASLPDTTSSVGTVSGSNPTNEDRGQLMSQIMDMQRALQALAESNSQLMAEMERNKFYQRQHSSKESNQQQQQQQQQHSDGPRNKRKLSGTFNHYRDRMQHSSSDSESARTGAPSPTFSEDSSQGNARGSRTHRREQFKQQR
jgi:regulator of replication initiation timing